MRYATSNEVTRPSKLDYWFMALGHIYKAFTCWPLKTRYGMRSWSSALDFIDNAKICLKSSLTARWR